MTTDITVKSNSSHKKNVMSFMAKGIYESEDMPMIQAQEVAQNSFDAIRTALKQGIIERGRIDVSIAYDRIAWTDNGIGMSEVELTNGFGTYGKSNKIGDLDTAGQYGIGVKSVINSSVVKIQTVKDGVRIGAWVSRDVLHIDSNERTGQPAGTTVEFILGIRKLKQDFLHPLYLFPKKKTDFLPVKFAERAVQLAFYLGFYDPRIDVYLNGQKVSPSEEFIKTFYYAVDFMGGKLYISPFSNLIETVLNVKGISYNVMGPGIRNRYKGLHGHVSGDRHVVVRRALKNIESRAIQSVYVTSLVDVSASRSEVSNFPALEKLLIGYTNDDASELASELDLENDGVAAYENSPPEETEKVSNVMDTVSRFQHVVSEILDRDTNTNKGIMPVVLYAINDRNIKTVSERLASIENAGKLTDSHDKELRKLTESLVDLMVKNNFSIDYHGASNLLLTYALSEGYFVECYVDEDGFLTLDSKKFTAGSRIVVDNGIDVLAYPVPTWLRSLPYDLFKTPSLDHRHFIGPERRKYFVPYMSKYNFDQMIGIYDRVYSHAEKIEDMSVVTSLPRPVAWLENGIPEDSSNFVTMSMVDGGTRAKRTGKKLAGLKSYNRSLMDFA